MSRGLTALTAVSSSALIVRPQYAAYLGFSGSVVRVWTGVGSRNIDDHWDSGSYSGVGTFGSVSAISETTEVAAKGIELTLTGVDSNYISLALTDNYRGRPVGVYVLLFDESGNKLDQTCIFRGRMDQMTIEQGDSVSTIRLRCENRLVDLNRPRERRYTHEYQQSLWPGDNGLEFMASVATKDIWWGNTGPSSVGNTPGDGGDEASRLDTLV